MKRLLILLACILWMNDHLQADELPPLVHSTIGTETTADDKSVSVKLVHKMQQFDWQDKATLDTDIYSPKSVSIHPNGRKFYVNSLEGAATVVYEMDTWRKLAVVSHRFDERHAHLWAPPCGLFPFTHYSSEQRNLNKFYGKPVEGCFSHGGRYFWAPYYRRSYDINAQDPSAMAAIDTESDTIVRLFETGPLPKMVACSHDNRLVAVTLWGNNTVGTIDVSSHNPHDWHYTKVYVVDYQLKLDFSLTESVDRDNKSGYTLRGTVFTPDDRYLLVGCMAGSHGIAVIDLQRQQYLGRVLGMRGNVRHLIISDGWLYLSSNASGYVQRMRLDKFLETARHIGANHTVQTQGQWQECRVMAGTRTIEASPSGRYIFAACNRGSKLCVVDTRTMKLLLSADVDSYPVGLDVSRDGKTVIVTSQGRGRQGGNAVNVFRASYAQPESAPVAKPSPVATQIAPPAQPQKAAVATASNQWVLWAALAAVVLLGIGLMIRQLIRR